MAETGEDADLSDSDEDSGDSDAPSPEAPPAVPVPKKPKYAVRCYDCCICNQSEPSTPSSPMALVAFQQTTRVLGLRIKDGHPQEALPFAEGARSLILSISLLFSLFLPSYLSPIFFYPSPSSFPPLFLSPF